MRAAVSARTVPFDARPMNGAVSNLATFPKSVGLLSRELRHGNYDVVHVHEPNAPYLSW